MKLRKLSKISTLHYIKLAGRSALFLGATALYIVRRIQGGDFLGELDRMPLLLGLIWLVYLVEMILRFFPSSLESMGCQKQFARNYKGDPQARVRPTFTKDITLIAVIWVLLNASFGVLYHIGIFDEGILLLISLAFAVCDLICILFFCPFQTWFMKNKCCGSCRIYNWDFAMMFSPLVFIKSGYTHSLVLCAVLLLVRWEVAAFRHPERFHECTNPSLACANCQEKLCHHKVQLQGFLKTHKTRFFGNGK